MDDGDFVGDSEEEEEEQEEKALVIAALSPVAPLPATELGVAGSPSATENTITTADEDRPLPDEVLGFRDATGLSTSDDGDSTQSAALDLSKQVSVDAVVGERRDEQVPTLTVDERDAAQDAADSPRFPGAPVEIFHDDESTSVDVETGPRAKFKVGDIVHVASRTWPGINKLGGAGKIASISTEASDASEVVFLYNVKYMLGGFEKRIEEEFIQYLADALATGVRQHKERVFYHDEFAKDPHKKQKLVVPNATSTEPPRHDHGMHKDGATAYGSKSVGADKPDIRVKKVELREKTALVDAPDIEYHARSSDDSDYDEDADAASDDQRRPRRILDKHSFILDQRQIPSEIQRQRKQERQSKLRKQQRKNESRHRQSKHRRGENQPTEHIEDRARKKRSHRIIDSEEEEEEEEPVAGGNHSGDDVPIHRSASHKRRSKKTKRKRYIGGYEHGSEDAEGSFIQPEGNPAELPDDVVKELKFKLGTTKVELRAQLETVADRLLENLGEFDRRKSDVASRLELSMSLDDASLQEVNHQLLELGEFVRTKFIRSGEDVMNLIIKMLEKKGASLPDRIDLQFENWKQRVAEHDVWVKQSLRLLGTTFDRRGVGDSFRGDIQHDETSRESESSSASDRSDQDDFEMQDQGYSPEPADTSPPDGAYSYRRKAREASSFDSPTFRQPASKKRPRSAVRTQSSLDSFAMPFDEVAREERFQKSRGAKSTLDTFVVPFDEAAREERFRRPSMAMASNFRFVRGRDDKILKDPRWDWARTMNRARSKGNAATTFPRSASASLPHVRSSVGHKNNDRHASESVMEAVLRLRDKRFRDKRVRPPTTAPPSRGIQFSSLAPMANQRGDFMSRAQVAIEDAYGGSSKASRPSTQIQANRDVESTVNVEQEPPRKWNSIFGVLSTQENIAELQTEATTRFAPLGMIVKDDPVNDDDPVEAAFYVELSTTTVRRQLSSVRQSLNALRAIERDTMDDILEERRQSEGENAYTKRTSWLELVACGNDFHTELLDFVEDLRHGLPDVHASELNAILESVITELASLLKQVPDCTTTIGDSPSYGYYFEVASPGARHSPLITAICRTYWYSIQVLVLLKNTCERCWPASRHVWEPIISTSLSPNRVALASCLFLIDLYLHIPSTHRFQTETELADPNANIAEVPALSLWQLLFEMFASGVIQSNKSGETSSLWHLLQTAYKQGIIDLVGISFMKRESFGGYVRERAPPKVLDSDEDLQGKLLAADVLWDLSCLLGSLVYPVAQSTPLMLSTSWSLARQLLSTDVAGFVPLNGLSRSCSSDDEFQLQAHGFKLRVLRRLLVLSAIWPPESDILEKIFPHLWDAVQEEEDQAVLSSIIDFIGEVRTLEHTENDTYRHAVAREHASRTTNSVELFCKIAVVQLSKLEKSIHRVRFRQPILRAISIHIEKHKLTLASATKQSEDPTSANGLANTKPVAKSWNWTKSSVGGAVGSNSGAQVKTESVPQSTLAVLTPKQVTVEVNGILSIVLMFGLSTVYLEEEGSAVLQQQPSARRKRDLKREIDFFCKELGSVSCEVPETAARLCACLSALGSASLDIGASYSTPLERINQLLMWTAGRLHQARQAESASKQQQRSVQSKLLAGAASTCVRALRDLSAQFLAQLEARSGDDTAEIEACINAALGHGLAAAIDATGEGGLLLSDLDLVIETLMLWIPTRENVTTRSVQFAPSATENTSNEFDEFDDPEMMDLLAIVDLENGLASVPNKESYVRSLQDQARVVAVGSLRLAIQKIVIAFPRKRWRSYQELYVIDLLGSMIASGTFPFNWGSVSLLSLKPRVFAPRLMASILQQQAGNDWFSTSFMSEQYADTDLSSMWLLATLDLRSLFPTTSTFTTLSPFSREDDRGQNQATHTAKYASYWLLLTDGILMKLLKEDPVVRYKMDQLMYQLLHSTATQCTYAQLARNCSDPGDIRGLYSMHVNVFRSFCRCASQIWQELSKDSVTNRQDMNRFRLKMMDMQRGVFVTLPEAYDINLRAVCQELDRTNINWYSLSSRFLDEFCAPSGSVSLHVVDDATSMLDRELADPAIRPLIVLFKFMYDCVDAFLFNCGGMAIGQKTIFSTIFDQMFRQARCAEFPAAERRLRRTRESNTPGTVSSTSSSTTVALPGVSPACVAFTESVRLFFAYQKYPSLINWFAQNLETYQTLKAGWSDSPLRVLLYNVFDPHGPLGIHSYYPMQDGAAPFDPRFVRREAFYFACGLLHCRCTDSYEHTRCAARADQEDRRAQLRRFVLVDFVRELREATLIDGESLDESLLPYFQLVKAMLNHLNLDKGTHLRGGSSEAAALCVERDLVPCLIVVVQHAIQKLRAEHPLDDSLSCVVLIEFICIVDELIRANAVLHDTTIQRFIDVGIQCAGYAYAALGLFSSAPLERLFTDECSTTFCPDQVQNDLVALESSARRAAVTTEPEPERIDVKAEPSRSDRHNHDDYGIGKARVRTDLLSVIRRLVQTCNEHEGHAFLQRAHPAPTLNHGAVRTPPVALAQVSVDGTI